MTQSTEQERAEFTDGAWYWVEKEGWHDEPPKIAPAMYRADCDAWYSWEFSGISTEYLKVMEPCVRHEQAARRAQVVPVPLSDELPKGFISDVLTAAGLVRHGKQCKSLADRLGDAIEKIWAVSIAQRETLAAAPQPPEGATYVAGPDVVPRDAEMVSCACGDAYPARSYGAGFIDASGACPNCELNQSAEVLLPEPFAWVWEIKGACGEVGFVRKRSEFEARERLREEVPDLNPTEAVYTESQVRELLARK